MADNTHKTLSPDIFTHERLQCVLGASYILLWNCRASWQGSLTNASWCLNPLSVCQRQKFGWLSVTFQLPPESKAQWQSGTSVYVMAFCFPLRILILFSFIFWFSFPPSQPCSSAIQLLCYECPKFCLPSASFLKEWSRSVVSDFLQPRGL